MGTLKLTAVFLIALSVAWTMESRSALAHPSPILTIGDSHTVGPFGREFYRLLRTLQHARVASYGVWGSSTAAWMDGRPIQEAGFFNPYTSISRKLNGQIVRGRGGRNTHTPLIADLLHQIRPELTIVELGANDLGEDLKIRDYKARALRIANAIVESGSQCVWIGPPNGRNKPPAKLETYYRTLREALETSGLCKVIDSRPYTRYPDFGGDGAHFNHFLPGGTRIAHHWALGMFRQIQRHIQNGGIR